ncbi:MAG: methyltransferase domain-containing protein [Chthoniobacterales bacterium]
MPGHWLLARLGKRVLRPGGLELTHEMLRALAIREADSVVEFAPGLGVTMRLVLECHPRSYTAIEQDEAAARRVRHLLTGSSHQCIVGSASNTGLSDESATVVYGEAMLTMQGSEQKSQIVREAVRILKPAGRYGIHELCLVPDDLDPAVKREIQQALSETIHVGAKPLTVQEWRTLLEIEGFAIEAKARLPMGLLTPRRLIADEGVWGVLRIVRNLCRDTEARRRVLAMRRIFHKYRRHLAAIMLLGKKRSELNQ